MVARGAEQRTVLVRTLTPAGWFEGGLQVPERSAMLDYLNRSGGLLRMTNVQVEGHVQSVAFLGIHRAAMRLVLPPLAETGRDETPHGPGESHAVAGVMEHAMFQGTVQIAPGMRVSDFFGNAKAFVRIMDCQVWLGRERGWDEKQEHPEVLVNAPAVIAITDTLST